MIDQAECHDENRVKEAFHSDPYWQSADLLCLYRYTIKCDCDNRLPATG